MEEQCEKESEEIEIASVSRRSYFFFSRMNVCFSPILTCVFICLYQKKTQHRFIIYIESGLYTCAHFINLSYGLYFHLSMLCLFEK